MCAKKVFLPIFCLLVFSASAQQITLSKDDIPRLAVDTISVDRGMRIVTYSDHSFRFIPAEGAKTFSTHAYGNNWDTVNIFAYRNIALGSLPTSIRLELTDSLKTAFRTPAKGYVISSYGPRGRRDHQGTDIIVAHGQPIYSAFDGMVRLSRWNSGGYGNLVIVRHANGLETYYAHLSRRAVVAGETVRAGQVVGYGGKTGRAFGLHLHFEMRYSDQSFDAERVIDFKAGRLRQPVFVLRRGYFNPNSRASDGLDEDDETLAADSIALAQVADSLGIKTTVPTPKPKAQSAKTTYHTIRSGDTLLGLANRYKTSVAEICRLNGITRETTLKVGKSLRIK